MKCRKCGKDIAENETLCDSCGATVLKAKRNFKITIPDEKLEVNIDGDDELYLSDKDLSASSDEELPFSDDTAADDASEEIPPKEESPEEDSSAELESAEPLYEAEEREDAETENKMPTKQRKTKERAEKAGTASEKKADISVKIICVFCAVLIAALAFLNIKTDIFKDSGSDKTVVLSGLSKSEEISFEEFISGKSILIENGYNSKTMIFDDIIPYIMPDSEYGLYAGKYKNKVSVSAQTDPAERYTLSDSTDGCCMVPADEISEIARSVGLTAVDDINTVDCYCYDGYYYFRAKTSDEGAYRKYAVDVTDSRKTGDGSYYITGDIYESAAKTADEAQPSGEALCTKYFIASLDKTDDSWILSMVSDEQLYDAVGNRIIADNDAVSYEMKSQTIDIVTPKGTQVIRYIIDYPYFTVNSEEENPTVAVVNSLYSSLIESFSAQQEDALKLYKQYTKNGGKKSLLPMMTHVAVSVTCNENGLLSLLERRTTYDPTPSAESDQETSAETQGNALIFPETVYEAYTYETESGEFVKKDDIMGKDYQRVIQQIFEYVSGETEASDTYDIGQKIYSSAWSLTPDGVLFCVQDENSAYEKITVPYDVFDNKATDILP